MKEPELSLQEEQDLTIFDSDEFRKEISEEFNPVYKFSFSYKHNNKTITSELEGGKKIVYTLCLLNKHYIKAMDLGNKNYNDFCYILNKIEIGEIPLGLHSIESGSILIKVQTTDVKTLIPLIKLIKKQYA